LLLVALKLSIVKLKLPHTVVKLFINAVKWPIIATKLHIIVVKSWDGIRRPSDVICRRSLSWSRSTSKAYGVSVVAPIGGAGRG
jgi:hypothetical protein